MVIENFPDPRLADDDGLLAVGGDMDVESLRLAYQNGIFPWPMTGMPLPWFSPPQRAILRFENLRINRSLRRAAKNSANFRYSLNRNFAGVIQNCAITKRPGQRGTWITKPLKDAYLKAHEAGLAQSVEVWRVDAQAHTAGPTEILVGGIYGMEVDGAFSAESMFYTEPYASKFALLVLIDVLKSQGCQWIDIQMMTPHLEAMGAEEISRDEFLNELERVHARKLKMDWSARSLDGPKI